jgi:hypothetical protein
LAVRLRPLGRHASDRENVGVFFLIFSREEPILVVENAPESVRPFFYK